MGIRVTKFGGSSLADAGQIKKVADILHSDSSRRYTVPSAPGKRHSEDDKITDLLYRCHDIATTGKKIDPVFEQIRARFMQIARELKVECGLKEELEEIYNRISMGEKKDYAASRGEYLNGRILAAYLGWDFVDAADVIRFTDTGIFDAQTTNELMKSELAKHEYAVIPGFYGARPDGTIKTFSRGGSDITGSIVARAVGAELYENWTDVSGFLVVDPRIVENPRTIHTITYRELRELSYMGATVLHEDAIYPARMANVPINIRNTNAPEDPGTMITSEAEAYGDGDAGRIITGIAGSKDFTVVALYKNMMSSERGFVRRILGILDDYDINFEHLPSGIDTVSVVMSNQSINGRLDEVLDEFRTRLRPDSIDVFENMALIATVGHGMSFRPGVSARLFTALADAGVNIRMIDQGSSEMNIIVGVENKDFETAIRAIYQSFVEV